MGKPVAILGASGFIGTQLLEWLRLNDVAEVRPVVRSYKSLARVSRFRLDWRLADALDEEALVEAFRGCETVFHTVVSDRATIVGSVEKCYRAARRAKVRRMVYLSSAVVHGPCPSPDTDDDSPLLLEQPFEYNVSKVLAEQRLRYLREDGLVEVVVLRPCIVFGPRSRWWTAAVAQGILEGRACLVDGGRGICNSIYVGNLVQAMWLAATHPAAAGQDFILTDGVTVTWRDLYEAVAVAVGRDLSHVASISSDEARRFVNRGRRRILAKTLVAITPVAKRLMPARLKGHPGVRSAYQKLLSSPVPRYQLDQEVVALQQCSVQLPIRKAREVLGYEPSVTFEEASRRTANWLGFALGMQD